MKKIITLILLVATTAPLHCADVAPKDKVHATLQEAVKKNKMGDVAAATVLVNKATQMAKEADIPETEFGEFISYKNELGNACRDCYTYCCAGCCHR